MKRILVPPRGTAARLNWIGRYDLHEAPTVHGPRYLIGFAFLAIVLLIVLLGIAIGTAAAEMFQMYTQWLKSLAAPVSG
jgi:hypothetical protein